MPSLSLPSSSPTATNSIGTAAATGLAAAVTIGMLWKAVSPTNKKPTYPHYVKLLPFEKGMLERGTAPVTTLTWFEGEDYTKVVPILRKRIERILKANPWLRGTFVKENGSAFMAYPHFQTVDDFLLVLEEPSESPIVYGRPIAEVSKNILAHGSSDASSLVLQMFRDFYQPFWRVALVPCRENPESRFAIVVSMGHVVGDGHTFYKLYEQLLHSQDEDVDVSTMTVERIENTQSMQAEYMQNEVNVLDSIGFIGCMVRGVLCKALASSAMFGWTMTKANHQVETRCVLLDTEKIEEAKRQAMKEQQRNENNEGVAAADPVSFVSTNDVLTSWFLSNAGCNHGLMALNFRNRIEQHTDDLGGNYENCLLYYPPFDTSTPVLIRQSLRNRKRVNETTRPFSSWDLAKSDVALMTNWATFAPFRHKGSVNLILPNCKQLLHVPAGDYCSMVPSSLASCIVFQATADKTGLLVTANANIMDKLKDIPFTETSGKDL